MATSHRQNDAEYTSIECEILILCRQVATDSECTSIDPIILISNIFHAQENLITGGNYMQKIPLERRNTD